MTVTTAWLPRHGQHALIRRSLPSLKLPVLLDVSAALTRSETYMTMSRLIPSVAPLILCLAHDHSPIMFEFLEYEPRLASGVYLGPGLE